MLKKTGSEKEKKTGGKHTPLTNEIQSREDLYTINYLPRFDPDGFWDGETIYDD